MIVAGLLGLYFSRRITEPLRTLSLAADEVAAGEYGVELPAPRGSDEIAHLSARFSDMAAKLAESEQLSRNFLMSVSHELRTPLTAIRGHVSALREGVIDDPTMREASLGVIGEEALRLERLVGDVLDLAKLDAHRFTVLQEEVDMERLSERAYAAFGEEARRREIDYRLDVRAKPVIVTDGDRVLQIIVNLLSNAFRWTPEGGRIELALSAENSSVSVAVADSGPGIKPEERDRIFRPFWSRDGGGTGLGLAIARELAVALGGEIVLDSEPGPAAGSCCCCRCSSELAGDAVDGGVAVGRAEPLLDLREALLDAAPAARHEVDEEGEVVDACVPLREEVAFDSFEAADHLVHEAADLGEVAADGLDLRAQPVLQRVADAGRERRLELGGRRGERLDLLARPLERRIERGRLDTSGCGLVDPSLGPLDRVGIHRGRRYRGCRWTSLTWTTSCRLR